MRDEKRIRLQLLKAAFEDMQRTSTDFPRFHKIKSLFHSHSIA